MEELSSKQNKFIGFIEILQIADKEDNKNLQDQN